MKQMKIKRMLSLLLTIALVLGCTISGLVFPTTAESGNVLGEIGKLDDPAINYADGVFKSLISKGATIVTDPDDSNNRVLEYMGGTYYLNLSGYVKKGVAYEFTCRMKGKAGESGVRAGTKKLNTHTTGILGDTDEEALVTTTEEWQTLTRYLVAGSNYNYVIGIQSKNAAVYFDDFSLVPLAAQGIDLPATATLGVGNSTTLEWKADPEGGVYDSIAWHSDNASLATVDANGVVTAKNVAGTVNITATITVGAETYSSTCAVNVVNLASDFTLSNTTLHLAPPTTSSIKTSKTLRIVETPKGAYVGKVTWSSSDSAVASVDQNGMVTALAEGVATITAATDLGLSAACVVTVDELGERLTGGDFESNDYQCTIWQQRILNQGEDYGQCVVVTEDGTDNHVLKMPKGRTSTQYLFAAPFQASQTYKVTFRAKGEKMSTYVHPSYTVSGDRNHVTSTLSEDKWTKVEIVFTTAASINRNYVIGFSNQGDSDLYIDDYSIVKLPKATALSVTPLQTELFPGRSVTLLVKTTPEEASTGAITWTSSDESIATVDANGTVTAVGESGTVTITGTSEDGMSVASVITVTEFANLIVNGDFELGAENWEKSFADSFQDGVGKDGTAGLVLNTGDNGKKRDYFYKNSLPLLPATRYEISFDYYLTETSSIRVWSGNIGCAYTPTHAVRGSWVHSTHIFTTPADLTLNKNYDLGLVCESGGTIVDNLELRMYATGVEAESIAFEKSEYLFAAGYSASLLVNAIPSDADLNRMNWVSSDPSVASVENGKVTAIKQGEAIITATTANGKTASCHITVMKPTSIKLNKTALTLPMGNSYTLTATAFRDSELLSSVEWQSSDAKVATVSGGVVSAISAGTATITAVVTDRVAASCVISVTYADQNAPIASAITVDPALENGQLSVSKTTANNGDTVTVTVLENNGYRLVVGSLQYVTADGTAHRILNKADGDFGEGNGNAFAFEMPIGAVTVTAAFEAIADENFSVKLIGTSLYQTENTATYTGIRFLSRMYVDALDLEKEIPTLRYNGKEYAIKEIGTLLKRSLNATALVLENYDAKDTKADTRLWKAVAYDGETMRLTDYTDSYLDFTVVMRTSVPSEDFDKRYYAVRAYVVLDDGTEDGLVVYTNEYADSVNDAHVRLSNTGSLPASHKQDVAVVSPQTNVSFDPVRATVREYLGLSDDVDAAATYWMSSHTDNDTQTNITIEWEEDGSESYRVLWADNAEFTSAKSVVTTNCSYRLTLLIPGKTYYWKVRNVRGAESEVRTFDLEEGPRWIDADGARNIRDTGGWQTADGKTVKYEMLYRGACIDNYNGVSALTEKGVSVFVNDLGIKTEIDLRGSDDGESGKQSESDFGGVYVKAPMDQYDRIFKSGSTKASLGKIMEVVSDESNYPIYFHCNAGADRTGTLAFIINGLLGVSYEDLTRDFEMTSFSTGKRLRSKLDTGTGKFEEGGVMQDNSSNYIAWGPLYEKMMKDYGTESGTLSDAIANFLMTECGVTAEEITAIRTLLVE